MANNYNTNPIEITATMAAGWKSLQTLNTQPILGRVYKIVWTGATSASHTFVIVDPNNTSNILAQGEAGTTLADDIQLSPMGDAWRDFQVTTIGSGTILIWYR
jgi:hypothetical protein